MAKAVRPVDNTRPVPMDPSAYLIKAFETLSCGSGVALSLAIESAPEIDDEDPEVFEFLSTTKGVKGSRGLGRTDPAKRKGPKTRTCI